MEHHTVAIGRISKRSVDALQEGSKDQLLWDNEVTGFGLKVTPRGGRTYLLQYRMGGRGFKTRRVTIGRHGNWTPEEARAQARRLRQLVDVGVDPREVERERQRTHIDLAFERMLDCFLDDYGKIKWSRATYATGESNLRRFALPVLRGKALPDISRADVRALRDSIPASKPGLRRSLFAQTRKMFSWAVSEGYITRSPFEGLANPQAAASRDRVITDDEIKLIWQASSKLTDPYGQMVRLLLLTGQRRDEVAGMRWEELDQEQELWTIPGARTKNGETQLVPLSTAVKAEIDALANVILGKDRSRKWPRVGYVCSTTGGRTSISGFSKAKSQLDAAIVKVASPQGLFVPAWRLHDLRRTLATGLQRLGVRFEVTEAVLNHVSGSRSGVAGVYQRHDWKAEKRVALSAWADHVLAAAA